MDAINYNDYGAWNIVTTQDGQKYYVIPGNEGYVYDPFLSQIHHRPVLHKNPTAAMAAKSEADAAAAKAAALQADQSSLGGQIKTPLIGAGATVLGNQLSQKGAFDGITSAAKGLFGGSSASTPVVTPAVTAAGEPVAAAAQSGFVGPMPEMVGPVAPGAEGAATGEAASTLGSVAPYLGVAGAGLGAYGIYNATKMHDKKQGALTGGLSGLGMGMGLSAAAPLVGLGPIGWAGLAGLAAAGAIAGGGLAHKTTGMKQAERWQAAGVDAPEASKNFDYFQGTQGEGSRDERFLTADNILKGGTPDNINDNPYWNQWNAEQQKAYVQKMLDARKVNEKKGGIYYDDDFAKSLAESMNADYQKKTTDKKQGK